MRSVLRRFLPLFLFAAIAAQGELLPTDLRGGHFTTLTLDAKYVASGAEEWEAFLSVDGGGFYSVRLTPHVDIAIRGYEILVPNVESSDVRILIRTGNERVETLHSIPQHFRIHADPDATLPLAHSASRAPEAACPGEAKVVVWSEGGRVESSAKLPLQYRATSAVRASEWDTVLPAHAIAPATQTFSRPFTPERRHSIVAARHSHDILLLSTRMNV
jgi:hypothetical protein